MARFTQDREDLLRDATALVPRLTLRTTILGQSCEVFVGFRGESVSLYFGPSPVFHFNSARELRRAFVDDRLIKAAYGQLVGSVRERSDSEVVLASTPLSQQEAELLTKDVLERISALRDILQRGDFELVGQQPADGDCLNKLRKWLAAWAGLRIAQIANVR